MISFMPTGGPRIARRDVAIAALFAVLAVPFIGWVQDGHTRPCASPARPVMGFLILLAVIPVLWRRRAPLLAAAGTLTRHRHPCRCSTARSAVAGCCCRLLFVEGFAVAAWLDRREALVGLAIVLGSGVVCLSADSSAGWGGLTISVPVTLAVWFIGRVVRSRAGMVARLLRAQRGAARAAGDQRAP